MPERLQSVLSDIIHPDQVGFMRNRYLRDIIRKVVNLIDYAKKKKILMVAFFADTEKAFDRMEWAFFKGK